MQLATSKPKSVRRWKAENSYNNVAQRSIGLLQAWFVETGPLSPDLVPGSTQKDQEDLGRTDIQERARKHN